VSLKAQFEKLLLEKVSLDRNEGSVPDVSLHCEAFQVVPEDQALSLERRRKGRAKGRSQRQKDWRVASWQHDVSHLYYIGRRLKVRGHVQAEMLCTDQTTVSLKVEL
jgi:hypothetical protein